MTAQEPESIVVRDQVRLGIARCFKLALSGMSYRVFRAGITISILALAVTFMVHMLTFGLLERRIGQTAYDELAHGRKLGEMLGRLETPDSVPFVIRGFAAEDATRVAEYARFSGASPEAIARARTTARRLLTADAYFDDLPPAPHAALMGDLGPAELFDGFARGGRGAFDELARTLDDLSLRPPLGSMEDFRRLIQDERPALLDLAGAVVRGHAAAIEKVSGSVAALAPGFGARLREAGFSIEDREIDQLTRFAARSRDLQATSRLLANEEVAAAVVRETGIERDGVTIERVADYVNDDRRAHWLASELARAGAPSELDAARIAELMASFRRERKLAAATQDFSVSNRGFLFGLPPRTEWLIALSFLVCVVGVANAMLMSVTERFTEIATMKCLGAMDGSVMTMFVLEAVIQGAVGGVAGLFLGLLLAIARAAFVYGSLLSFAGGAAGTVALAALASFALGILLAAVAAVGPSFIAARLAPMEAMRVE